MQEFEKLEENALLDALAHYTARYTKMIADGAPREDSMECRKIIQSILSELETRKRLQDNSAKQTTT